MTEAEFVAAFRCHINTALLSLLDAATVIVQAPPEIHRQRSGTFEQLLEYAKTLDRLLDADVTSAIAEVDHTPLPEPAHPMPETPQNAPERPPLRSRPAKRPGRLETAVLGPSAPATDDVGVAAKASEPPKREYTGDRLPFAVLDPLVKSEMKRLSMDGRMPSHRLWDAERDRRLPTLGAILLRYNAKSLSDLAGFFGMQPPLSAKSSSQIGADPAYQPEAAP